MAGEGAGYPNGSAGTASSATHAAQGSLRALSNPRSAPRSGSSSQRAVADLRGASSERSSEQAAGELGAPGPAGPPHQAPFPGGQPLRSQWALNNPSAAAAAAGGISGAGGAVGSRAAASRTGAGGGGWPPFMELFEVTQREAMCRRQEQLQGLPAEVQEGVVALEALDTEVCTLQARFRQERRELERRYEQLYAPLFKRRAALVSGEHSPAHAAQPAAPSSEAAEMQLAGAPPPQPTAFVVGVPEFWLRAMKGSAAIAGNVTSRDEVALRSLLDITCSTLPEFSGKALDSPAVANGVSVGCGVGFRLEFYFHHNDFFTNDRLVKTYHLRDTDAEAVLETVMGTQIHWKPGKDLTMKHVSGALANEAGARPRVSFFNFFLTPRLPALRKGERLPEEVISSIEADYQMGLAFKEKIIPHAVRWFTREAEDEDEYEDRESDFQDGSDGLDSEPEH